MRYLKTVTPVTKKLLGIVLCVVILAAIGFVTWLKISDNNPLPPNIKNQVSFKVVYPPAHLAPIDSASYDYQARRSVLHFTASFAGSNIIFSEQPAPDNLGSDTAVYYPALGIHPYAQFKTGQGIVALTKFWQAGNLQPYGQAAVMVSKGTLLIAHSDKPLTNQQWKSLFDSLKTAR